MKNGTTMKIWLWAITIIALVGCGYLIHELLQLVGIIQEHGLKHVILPMWEGTK